MYSLLKNNTQTISKIADPQTRTQYFGFVSNIRSSKSSLNNWITQMIIRSHLSIMLQNLDVIFIWRKLSLEFGFFQKG